MGTRYEDQPVEQWAGPESLDPTPVWKQYALVGVLLVVGLAVILIVAAAALAPQLATPPALVPGDRLVLAGTELPPVGAQPRLVDYPWLGRDRAFYLAQPGKGDVLALRARWAPRSGEPECAIVPRALGRGPDAPSGYATMDCPLFRPADTAVFDATGMPASAGATRGLDRYLVSVSGDRLIVNMSRLITPDERTGGPVPTGIPTPQATP